MGIGCVDNLERKQCLQLLSILDDWMALAQYQIAQVLHPNPSPPSTKQIS